MSGTNPQTLIVYGPVSDPATLSMAFDRQAGALTFVNGDMLTTNYAAVSPSSPGLRLSSPGWINFPLQKLAEVNSTEGFYQLCHQRIVRLSSPFSKMVRQFLESYMAFMTSHLSAHKADLGDRSGEDEIFDYRDWIFSAWLPLPHAQVLIPAAHEAEGPSFAELDTVFWTGDELIGIVIDGLGTPIKSKRKLLDLLSEHHPLLKLVRIPKDKLGEDQFPIDLFPDSFARFWQGIMLPHGPSPPRVLMDDSAPLHLSGKTSTAI